MKSDKKLVQSEQGARLRQVRIHFRKTQSEMASDLHYRHPSGYSQLETGRNRITDTVLQILKYRFGVSPDFVVSGEEPMLLPDQGRGSEDDCWARLAEAKKEIARLNDIISALVKRS